VRSRSALPISVCLVCASASIALAQSYPTRIVRLVVPSSPGGGTDLSARVIAPKLGERLGQQVVVENRPGAGSVIGNEFVAKAAADGHTLLMGISTLAILPSMVAKLPYDTLKDFLPVTVVVRVSNALTVHPSVPVTSVKGLIALAKSKPGSLTYSSAGAGTNPHLAAELFLVLTKLSMVHVPYKGSGPAVVGLLGGETALSFASVPSVINYLKAGRLRALGVTTAKRSSALPDIPTIAEAGVPGYEAQQWFGVVAPGATPRGIVERLHKELLVVLKDDEVVRLFAAQGADIVANTPEEFAAYLRSELDKWARVIKAAGIEPLR
jgi:tripartite-type tricarboxylate transporter receptor subunit TctC